MARNLLDTELLRLRVMLAGMLAVFGLLGAFLWQIQVERGHSYERDLVQQSVRRIRLPGVRGRIYDRNGARLADNRPNYCIAVFLEELRQPGPWDRTVAEIRRVLDRVAEVIQVPPQITEADIRTHIRKRLPLPLIAWRDLDERTMARWAESVSGMRGVDVYTEAVRVYPQNAHACHLLGYVGRAEPPDEEEEPFHYYVPEMAGRSGVEKRFDDLLRGEPGGRLVQVDVSGYRHDDIGLREPKSGHDLQLALDARVQALAEQSLGGEPGAVVVLDPSNGDVLAMASLPGYDLNEFVPAISAERWAALNADPLKPLINRAVGGRYTPGSTFKPVVALAALEADKANAGTQFSCPGYFSLGSATFSCWYHPGHGTLDMRAAIQNSCNVYFFRLSLQCGYEYVYHMASAMGFGRATEIELDGEVAGLLPNDAWKRRTQHDAWRDGDTCNLAIGQGALVVTPLQMAVMAATLANGGTVYRPRVVVGVRGPGEEAFEPRAPQVANAMNWSPETVRVVREGMRAVVMAERGTGRLAQAPGVTIAGKTGTAEYGVKGSGQKYGWMIAFAPYEKPRYAVALVVDEAISGGVTAAPRMGELMRGLFAPDGEGKGAG